jgi:hypothetical protein
VAAFLAFLADVFKEHGAVAVSLVVVSVLFYKMTWSVWRDAMKAKDEEIDRLVGERNKYQDLVFERLLSSRLEDDVKAKAKANGTKDISEAPGKPDRTEVASPKVSKTVGES